MMTSRRISWMLAVAATGLWLAGCATPRSQPAATPLSPTEVRAASLATLPPATDVPSPTPTGSPTSTLSPTPTSTATPSPTPSPSATPTATPLPTPDGVAREVRVPILMYHHLSEPPAGSDRYRRDLSVSPALFEQHLAYLHDEGYQSITLYDLVNALARGAALPPKPVILTFDDGYRDNYTNAFPLLKQYGFTATFFVLTDVTYQGLPDYLTWDEMREMTAGGMDIECHARVHEDLTDNDDARLVWQVLGCREAIEQETGRRPRFVAYPSGIYDARVAAFFASDQYWGAVSTQQGAVHRSDALFALKRLRVRNTTTLDLLAELLDFQELPEP